MCRQFAEMLVFMFLIKIINHSARDRGLEELFFSNSTADNHHQGILATSGGR